MDQPDISPPAVAYKDRSTGLMVFGIMTMLLGGLSALLVPLMIFAQSMAAKDPAMQGDNRVLLPGILMYGGLAVVLIWLGIGSLKARRWARALLLIFSWSWLLVGIIALVIMATVLPNIMQAQMQIAQPAGQPPMPEAAKLMMVVIPLLFVAVIFVALPVVWVLFYRSRHVKATCEARDPVRRWTDACPLPVLAVSLWLAFSVAMTLMMPFAYRAVLPFFGEFLSGLPGTVGYVVLACLWAWCAWQLYQLKAGGWWLTIFLFGLLIVSHVVTYARHDVTELYVLMGYPEQQIEEMKKFTHLTGGWMTWGMLVFALPFFGYMIYVKKFFRPAQVPAA